MSEENKNLNTISEDTANADSNAVAETADKKEDTKAKKNKKNKSEKGRIQKVHEVKKSKTRHGCNGNYGACYRYGNYCKHYCRTSC